MDWKKALKIVGRQSPCPHHSVDISIGDGKTWAKCYDCGAIVLQESFERAQKAAKEFDDALELLHKIASSNNS